MNTTKTTGDGGDTAKTKVLITGAAGLLGSYVVKEMSASYELSGLDLRAGDADIAWHTGDINDSDLLRRAVAGQDAVIHIAAIPNIWAGSPETIMETNVQATYKLMLAAEEAGASRIVFCSSDSAVGFTVRDGAMIPPDYVPIDENHPLNPTDPYGLSKAIGEDIGRSFAQRDKLSVVALRPMFIAFPEMYGELRARAASPDTYAGPQAGGPSAAGGGVCWNHVDPRDVSRAFRLAVELQDVHFERFFVSAATTLAPDPTLERLETYLGRCPLVRNAAVYQSNPHAPLFDLSLARERLGFEPRYDARAVVGLNADDAT